MVRKYTKKYYFSVEGETEKWYLEWLRDCINSLDEAEYRVMFDCKVEKSPTRRIRKMLITDEVEIWHLSDYESADAFHKKQFQDTIDELHKASHSGKNVTYRFGYSNFTFDLWIILHKKDCNGPKVDRKQYLADINNAYHQHFLSMQDYKHYNHFLSCLKQLSIDDVKMAVIRSKK